MKRVLHVLISVTILLCSCTNNNGGEIKPKPYVPFSTKSDMAGISENYNDFSLKFMKVAFAQNVGKENIFISPYSFYNAMTILANGATGETLSEILMAMGITSDKLAELNTYCADFNKYLKDADNTSTFRNSNALFAAANVNIKNAFRNTIESLYDTQVENLDFTKSSAGEHINNWIDEATEGMVTQSPARVNSQTMAAIYNAILLKCRWSEVFKTYATRKDIFNNPDGSKKEIDMMSKSESTIYNEDDLAQYLSMGFGNGTFNAMFILPKNGKTTNDMVDQLNGQKWASIHDEGWVVSAAVKLPRFTVNSPQIDMTALAGTMGITKAMTQSAEFSAMSDTKLFVSQIAQSSKFELDEDGCKAVSVTTVVMGETSSGMRPTNIEFTANRPFIFAIYEKSTRNILFIGEVNRM